MDMLPPLPPNLSFESQAKILIEASEANIARIESQIRDLERLRDRERGTIAQLRMAIAPVRKMPAELLVKIFLETCVLDLFHRYRLYNKEAMKQVQTLSHVCAHWRQIAITTPRLWSDVLPIKLGKTPTEAYIAGLKEWLGRSAPFPIPVHLSCVRTVDTAAVFAALLTVADRWSDAHFQLPSLSVLSSIPSNALKQLQKLTVESPDSISAPMAAFLLAPNLRVVSLEIAHIAPLMMPWSRLTHLTVTSGFPQECLDTLVRCQNLVIANFTMPAWPGRPDVSELKPTTLGKLEFLQLDILDSTLGSIAPFFACLALPALHHLLLDLDYDLDWATTEFTQFQLRSPNIESLGITSSGLDSEVLMPILRHTPALSNLTLRGCPEAFDETVATALSSSHQTHTQLVPRLHTLSIDQGCPFLGEDTLDALVAARWWTDDQLVAFPLPPQVSRWSDIYIHRDVGDDDPEEDLSPEFEAKLDEYRRQGLTIYLY
ncbi:hypothetical protein C8R46DRAFT_1193623 [Mycena filopes]|nr:hypothetical protein C8R46DRAFT_1193623 [Mycena filopes]